MTVAIIQFPGSNCEEDTVDALNALGIKSTIIQWLYDKPLDNFSGFILPGGFSYQDRVRAGVIAAKLNIIQALKQQVVQKKPILGICNGAQILIESGMLSSNNSCIDTIIDANYVNNQMIHFISDWAFLTPFNSNHSIFLRHFDDGDIIPIQICHGEGRYIFNNTPSSGLKYCTLNGDITPQFPITPNGSSDAIAGITNTTGNVMAIMPHPERSIDVNRYPFSIREKIKQDNLTIVDWSKLFLCFKDETIEK